MSRLGKIIVIRGCKTFKCTAEGACKNAMQVMVSAIKNVLVLIH